MMRQNIQYASGTLDSVACRPGWWMWKQCFFGEMPLQKDSFWL